MNGKKMLVLALAALMSSISFAQGGQVSSGPRRFLLKATNHTDFAPGNELIRCHPQVLFVSATPGDSTVPRLFPNTDGVAGMIGVEATEVTTSKQAPKSEIWYMADWSLEFGPDYENDGNSDKFTLAHDDRVVVSDACSQGLDEVPTVPYTNLSDWKQRHETLREFFQQIAQVLYVDKKPFIEVSVNSSGQVTLPFPPHNPPFPHKTAR